jgi:flagellar biosynthesis chaperone FliJ
MTPKQLNEALRIRRRREEKALATMQQAGAMRAQAEAGLAAAHGALHAYDAQTEASMNAFLTRSKLGINPDSVTGMRGFHADRLIERDGLLEPIALAERAVDMALQAEETARRQWRLASQAAENLQELNTNMKKQAMRGLERRQEQDRDEIAATRAARPFAE